MRSQCELLRKRIAGVNLSRSYANRYLFSFIISRFYNCDAIARTSRNVGLIVAKLIVTYESISSAFESALLKRRWSVDDTFMHVACTNGQKHVSQRHIRVFRYFDTKGIFALGERPFEVSFATRKV